MCARMVPRDRPPIIPAGSNLNSIPIGRIDPRQSYLIESIVTFTQITNQHYESAIAILRNGTADGWLDLTTELWGAISNLRRVKCLLAMCPGISRRDLTTRNYLAVLNKSTTLGNLLNTTTEKLPA